MVERRSLPLSMLDLLFILLLSLLVLTVSDDRICAMTRFENTVLPWFGLPRSLPGR